MAPEHLPLYPSTFFYLPYPEVHLFSQQQTCPQFQNLEKGGIISGSPEGRSANQPTVHHMIDRTGILKTQGLGHMRSVAQANETLNNRLDP
jgi:hypothetical protein